MPCHYDPGPDDLARSRADAERRLGNRLTKLTKDLDKLTHENDILREAVLAAAEAGFDIPPASLSLIEKEQIAHRKEDLKRLEKTFKESKDAQRLGLVVLADPTKPLEPQLGFDPDEF